jgi:hypothetical protein
MGRESGQFLPIGWVEVNDLRPTGDHHWLRPSPHLDGDHLVVTENTQNSFKNNVCFFHFTKGFANRHQFLQKMLIDMCYIFRKYSEIGLSCLQKYNF